ncbi:MAG: NAD(P)(+) transhydrogenase (Re/Si-specific) subunit beta, partial [Acidobacteria bacterium]|nr:NAD(P)(+) transhydrogenase (Re/Si-specific) subunit beta [Acidobacteriota bacterium]
MMTPALLFMIEEAIPQDARQTIVHLSYIIAAGLFVLALKWMNSPATARRGVFAGELGMLIAIVSTLVSHQVVSFELIFIAFLVGSAIGVPLAYLMP